MLNLANEQICPGLFLRAPLLQAMRLNKLHYGAVSDAGISALPFARQAANTDVQPLVHEKIDAADRMDGANSIEQSSFQLSDIQPIVASSMVAIPAAGELASAFEASASDRTEQLASEILTEIFAGSVADANFNALLDAAQTFAAEAQSGRQMTD